MCNPPVGARHRPVTPCQRSGAPALPCPTTNHELNSFTEQSGVLREMERVEAEAQHLGAGGEHSRSSTHTELRAGRGAAAPGPQEGEGTLARRAGAQRIRGASPTARETQGGSTLEGIWQNWRNDYHEPACEAARFY